VCYRQGGRNYRRRLGLLARLLEVGRAYFITRTGGQQRPPLLEPKSKGQSMSKKQTGCVAYTVALIAYVVLGWVIVKFGIQPVAETYGHELPTGATLILVFWVQSLAALQWTRLDKN